MGKVVGSIPTVSITFCISESLMLTLVEVEYFGFGVVSSFWRRSVAGVAGAGACAKTGRRRKEWLTGSRSRNRASNRPVAVERAGLRRARLTSKMFFLYTSMR